MRIFTIFHKVLQYTRIHPHWSFAKPACHAVWGSFVLFLNTPPAHNMTTQERTKVFLVIDQLTDCASTIG
ncbi:hypothetical protein M3M33_15510, partial [Loigolactobacillus coryniformis]|uniref:hypothetical protein n=1 Tax=Loigolactobacillus coryniformis TaxID=1610 RepID=UPI00201B01B9